MPHGIVSLLDEASDRETRALWTELDAHYGLRAATQRAPYPHTSYQVAEEYDLIGTAEALARVAARHTPFTVTVTGLGAFLAPEPVLYLAIARNAALDSLHQSLWVALAQTEGIARGASPLYAPGSWVPHITLAQLDLTLDALHAIQSAWAGRDLRRDIRINDLAVLYQAPGRATYEAALRFALGSPAPADG